MTDKQQRLPESLSVGDSVYNPLFGKGTVNRLHRSEVIPKRVDYIYVNYQRQGLCIFHTGSDLIGMMRKKQFWQMQDRALMDRTPTHWIETHQFQLQTHKMTSCVKPAYLTPSGRLRFSVPGDPMKHGIALSSLGQVRFNTPDLLVMYVNRDDPKKEKHKASLWKATSMAVSRMNITYHVGVERTSLVEEDGVMVKPPATNDLTTKPTN